MTPNPNEASKREEIEDRAAMLERSQPRVAQLLREYAALLDRRATDERIAELEKLCEHYDARNYALQRERDAAIASRESAESLMSPTVSDASSATTPNVNEISSSLVVGGATPDGIYAGVDVCPLNEWLDFHNRGQVTKDDRYLRIADVPRLLKNAVSSATREAENAWDRRELGASMEHAHPAQQQRQPQGELGKGANIEQG